ncbi:hypothetical protein [Sciscionella marina]|uniref:hypothetical protein n=1 Tax=Sciscionella marina TaxID=508770 RepID=UPI00037780F0|nr:hypothetical protein [Sciscionella marina]
MTVEPGATLSEEGRRAAIGASLGLLGRYFASGTQPLERRAALGLRERDGDTELTELLAGLRLRVALAAAHRLRELLDRIAADSSFRYRLRTLDRAGAITGQLDVNRYLAQLGTGEHGSFPVLEVHRSAHTPENILAAYAARWLTNELRTALASSAAAEPGPEHAAARSAMRALGSLLRLPEFAACVPEAAKVRRKHGERTLLGTVRRRLRRREIASGAPYAELADWIERVIGGEPVASAGELEWSFYGERFDTKLFELWCLRLLATVLARTLRIPEPEPGKGWRTGDPAYLLGEVELSFQRSIPGRAARWLRTGTGRALGGVPDIVARRGDRISLIDPKLRRRAGPPTEELYKILGYFENFRLTERPCGAILYYAPEPEPLREYRYAPEDGAGSLFAIGVDPVRPRESSTALVPLVRAILD